MKHMLLEQLQQRPLLCDGAMGSLLYARGVGYEQCFDALNLAQPELIQGIHREYISAGAQIIETNTFGANRAKLESYNLEERVREINHRAARLALEAREVAGQPVFIAEAVGPTGRPLQAPDEHRLGELRAIFREQIEGLQVGGTCRQGSWRTTYRRTDELLRGCPYSFGAVSGPSRNRPERFRCGCHGRQL